jgi:hypothetical protein
MKITPAKAIASALAVSLLVLPAGLSAKERRGAELVVTRLDGSQVSGELIAVKRDSLLLLNNVGRDESTDLAEIKSVRLVRKSRAGKGALYGFLVGAAGGALWGSANQDSDVWGNGTALIAGAYVGAIGALSGLLLGSVAGLDSSFTVAGKPEAVVNEYWVKLRTHAREPRLPGRSPSSR